MTLQEAIKTLENFEGEDFVDDWAHYLAAFQLGIEALKKIQYLRSHQHFSYLEPLPGETKE